MTYHSEATPGLHCEARIIREGYDKKSCLVHVRGAADGRRQLLTGQWMADLFGCDFFGPLHYSVSEDGGASFTPLTPDPAFQPLRAPDGLTTQYSDMPPFFHRTTGRFIVTGHTADYEADANRPAPFPRRHLRLPYTVFDWERRAFSPVRFIDPPADIDMWGSGCTQILELPSGDLLLPVRIQDDASVAVIRCTFDGERMQLAEVGNHLPMPDEPRGPGEASLLFSEGRFYMSLRADNHGYIAASDDGLHFSAPELWRFDDGEILPTHNTQAHWFTCAGRSFLVYTRRTPYNEHIFRSRAPLFAANLTARRCACAGTRNSLFSRNAAHSSATSASST